MALGILTKKCETLLASSFNATDFSLLSNGFKELEGDDEMKRLAMEQSFKMHVLRQLASSEPDLGACQKAVGFSIQAARGRMVNATMPTTLLSDLFDVITLDNCQVLFECVERNVAVWKEDLFFAPVKNNILRICNDLLRRLSRPQQTVFCGRILLFLARFFPITERSGLNVVSEFNLDNTTVYSERSDMGDDNAATSADGDEPQETEKMEIEDDHKDLNIDYALYKKFWMLQDFFRRPQQCYERLQWKTFITYSNEVLNTFKSFKLDAQSGKRKKNGTEDVAMESTSSAPPEQYFAKYLTNQNLLQLQLSDSNFRRYILVQFLILFQYLQSSVKFKSDSEVLSDEQSRWIKSNRERVFSLMAETPPDGQNFSDSVKHMLQREEQWIGWKNDGCKAFTDAKAKAAAAAAAAGSNGESNGVAAPVRAVSRKRKRPPVGEHLRMAMKQKKFIMGNNDLTKLWNLYPDNMEACSAPERDFLPKMEEYFEDAIEQLVPANMVEEQYKKVNDGAWGWRALRLLAKKTPHFFTYGNHPIAKLPDYLDSMIRKIVKEPSFQDSESAKQLLASMEVKPVAAASSSGSANTSAEEPKVAENNAEDKEMEEGEVPKTPTTPTKTSPKPPPKKMKSDTKPAEESKATKVKIKK